MSRKKHTTVILTDLAQEIKEDLAPIFGLKNILSAGLILMSRLSAEEKQTLIGEANGVEYNDPEEKIRKLKQLLSLVEGSEYRILSKAESALVKQLRVALGPEPKHKKQKAKGG